MSPKVKASQTGRLIILQRNLRYHSLKMAPFSNLDDAACGIAMDLGRLSWMIPKLRL